MRFSTMWKNEKTADVYISDDRKTVEINRYTEVPYKQPFNGTRLDLDRVYSFLKGRCYEDGRDGLDEILAKAGLTSNDPWKWNRLTHGVTWEDFIWIKWEGEDRLRWEDVRVRE